jgi:hypothetical protein
MHRRKTPSVLMKLDISKAFDTLSWDFLFHTLRKRGFGPIICNLLCGIFRTAYTRIMINGVERQFSWPGVCAKAIRCRPLFTYLLWIPSTQSYSGQRIMISSLTWAFTTMFHEPPSFFFHATTDRFPLETTETTAPARVQRKGRGSPPTASVHRERFSNHLKLLQV